jgi:hypothetical protein
MAELQQEGSLSGLLELRMLPMAEQQAQTSLSAELQQLQPTAEQQPQASLTKPATEQQLVQPAQAQLQHLQPAAQQQPQASLSPQLEPAKEEQQPQLTAKQQQMAVDGLALTLQQLTPSPHLPQPLPLRKPQEFWEVTPARRQILEDKLLQHQLDRLDAIPGEIKAARAAWSTAAEERARLCSEQGTEPLYVEHSFLAFGASRFYFEYGCTPQLKAAQRAADAARCDINSLRQEYLKLTAR